jgi:hypothetical protein
MGFSMECAPILADRKFRGFDGSLQPAKVIETIRLPMCLGKGTPIMWAYVLRNHHGSWDSYRVDPRLLS